MTKLTQFLEGKIRVQDFSKALQNDPALQSEVRNIIPAEARMNSAHPYW